MIIYFTNIPKCWCVIIDRIFSNAHANNDRTFNSWPKHLGWNCKLERSAKIVKELKNGFLLPFHLIKLLIKVDLSVADVGLL